MSPAAEFDIRYATGADASRLASIGARLFTQAYGPTHPEPELSRYLARCFDVGVVAKALADDGTTFLLACDVAGADIGYAWLHETKDVPPNGVVARRPFEIVRFYVDEPWHGRGVAQALMAACVAEARAREVDVMWLATWQPAARAQAFYRRMGFEIVGTTTFRFGDVLEDDFLMARRVDS
jgi:ribosomal protein S18 acetylase RimI-like enzyme